MMEQQKEYFAFISYQREDEDWAKWLAHELEHYHLPLTLNGRDDLPHDLRPIFRDIDELSAGNLPQQIHQALMNSNHLIVICSPRSAKSQWVNKEILEFVNAGKTDKIFPFIIDGIAMCKDSGNPHECFPPALRHLPKNEERLGGNINDKGRDAAVVKIIAGMLGLHFDTLWQRYEREKAEEERKIKEQRDHLLRVQARFLAEKIIQLTDDGDAYTARLLGLEILPSVYNPDYPHTAEAEFAFRKACSSENCMFNGHESPITCIALSPDDKTLASVSVDNSLRIWDVETGNCVATLQKPSIMEGAFYHDYLDGLVDEMDSVGFNSVEFSPDGRMLITTGRDATVYVWDLQTRSCIRSISNSEICYDFEYATFTPDMKSIITAGQAFEFEEYPTALMKWSLESGRLDDLFLNSSESNYLCFSPDGKHFASSSLGNIEIWSVKSKKRVSILRNEWEDTSYSNRGMIKFSPDGGQLAFSYLSSIQIWDFKTQRLLRTMTNNGNKINCFCYTSEGKYIMSAGEDKMLCLWDVMKGECVHRLPVNTDAIISMATSKDNHSVFLSGNGSCLKKIDINIEALLDEKPYSLSSYPTGEHQIVSPNNVYKVTYDSDNDSIYVEPLTQRSCEFFLCNPHPTAIHSLIFSHDDESLLTLSYSSTICIYTHLSDLMRINEEIMDLDESTRDERALIAEQQHLIKLKEPHGSVSLADFSPDGKYVVSCNEESRIKIWDVASGQCLHEFSDMFDSVHSITFSADGDHIFICYEGDKMKSLPFQSLETLIDETRVKFNNRQLTPEERRKYYLD